jgi:outer membrane biosynthesis protein TonB
MLNPGQVADLVLAWRQVAGLIESIPHDRPLADDMALTFRLPPPAGVPVTAAAVPVAAAKKAPAKKAPKKRAAAAKAKPKPKPKPKPKVKAKAKVTGKAKEKTGAVAKRRVAKPAARKSARRRR